jgi:acyl dehydratase
MLAAGIYTFDQVQVGDCLLTDWAKVTPQAIDSFAALTQDRFAIHLSDEGARAHGFDRRVAHGLLILSLVEGLKSTAPAQLDTFASLGWEWTFRAPVFAGDSIRATVTVTAKRAAGAGKGMLTLSVSVENQDGAVVQHGQTRLMARRAPPAT